MFVPGTTPFTDFHYDRTFTFAGDNRLEKAVNTMRTRFMTFL